MNETFPPASAEPPPAEPSPSPPQSFSYEPTPAGVPWSVRDSVATYALWFAILLIAGTAILLGLQQLLTQQLAEAVMLPVTLMLLIAVTIGYVRFRYPDDAVLLLGWRRPTWSDVGIGLGVGLAALLVLGVGLSIVLQLIANALQTELPPVQETFRQLAADRAAMPWLVLSSVLVAPVAEELFFRGMLFQALRRRLPLWPSIGISSLLFGLTHVQLSLEGYLLVLLIIVPLGMVLAYVLARRGTLLVPILIHATFNLVQVIQLVREVG